MFKFNSGYIFPTRSIQNPIGLIQTHIYPPLSADLVMTNAQRVMAIAIPMYIYREI